MGANQATLSKSQFSILVNNENLKNYNRLFEIFQLIFHHFRIDVSQNKAKKKKEKLRSSPTKSSDGLPPVFSFFQRTPLISKS